MLKKIKLFKILILKIKNNNNKIIKFSINIKKKTR